MLQISNKLTKLLGIKTPIISAPMAGASGGKLAASVSHAGGFGFIAAGYDDPDSLKKELETSRLILGNDMESHGLQTTHLPVGVGFLVWQLEKHQPFGENLLTLALENNVRAVWFAFGQDIGKWVDIVREHDKRAKTGVKTIVFVQVSTIEEALIAANVWRVDVLVAQGNESGGHGLSSALPLLTLIPEILSKLPLDGPLLLGAGGLSNGSHLASILALGVSGAVFGTRFLLTPESLYSDIQKEALVKAKSTSTVRTMAFDHARGTLGWPQGVDGRGLRNRTVEDFDSGLDIKEVKERFSKGVKAADPARMVIWAGTGVGLMNSIKPARDVVNEIHQEATQRLKAVSILLSDEKSHL